MECKIDRCQNIALTNSEYCWNHHPDKEGFQVNIIGRINKGESLNGYNLQRVVLKGSVLEKADFTKTNLSQADFSGSHLFDSKFEGADLIGADFSNCDLTHSDLKGADLTKARFVNARLWNANLMDSNLTECDMTGADLWDAKLFNVKLWHAVFTAVRSMTQRNFACEKKFIHLAKINETGLLSAQESYRDLKGYFLSNGMYDDASWASFKEKSLERLSLLKKRDLGYFPSLIMNILCGYGEKPSRIVLSAFTAILSYAILYFLLNTVERSGSPNYILKWSDYIYYSTITFTTVGYGDFIPRPSALFRLLAACEAFTGVFLSGLFIFTLARKYSAR